MQEKRNADSVRHTLIEKNIIWKRSRGKKRNRKTDKERETNRERERERVINISPQNKERNRNF